MTHWIRLYKSKIDVVNKKANGINFSCFLFVSSASRCCVAWLASRAIYNHMHLFRSTTSCVTDWAWIKVRTKKSVYHLVRFYSMLCACITVSWKMVIFYVTYVVKKFILFILPVYEKIFDCIVYENVHLNYAKDS